MSALELFLTVASDLYRTDPDYRREVEQERDPRPDPAPAPVSTWEKLTELDWLIRNGMPYWLAPEQVGWTLDTAQTAAIRWQHPVHTRLQPDVDPAPSGHWAAQWSAGMVA